MVKKIIIADTNWWISLVIAKFDNSFANILELNELTFYSCEELEREISMAFSKAKLQRFLTPEVINLFWFSFRLRTTQIKLVSTVTICRDPKDNFLLALAKDSQADFLITGDSDLLELRQFEKTIICTLPEFIKTYLHK